MPDELTGRVAVVTGAARGIGRAITQRLGEAGAAVALLDILPEVHETAAALAQSGGRTLGVVVDVADAEALIAALAQVAEQLGPCDVLVNNAGWVSNIAPFARMSRAAWDRELAINLSAAFTATQAVIEGMAERGWGRVVNIASIAVDGLIYQVGYAASKAGLLGLTKTVALEYAARGVTANVILPGMVASENVRAMREDIQAKALARIPERRFGEPSELAELAAFLASDRAAYLTGVAIPFDGGSSLQTLSLATKKFDE